MLSHNRVIIEDLLRSTHVASIIAAYSDDATFPRPLEVKSWFLFAHIQQFSKNLITWYIPISAHPIKTCCGSYISSSIKGVTDS